MPTALAQDLHVKDMAEDLRESMDYGDPISTWFDEDGQPHGWFVSAAAAEYERRTGQRADGKDVAAALYSILNPDAE